MAFAIFATPAVIRCATIGTCLTVLSGVLDDAVTDRRIPAIRCGTR
jgi:hypothetical protein